MISIAGISQKGKRKLTISVLLYILIAVYAFPSIGQAAADYSERIQDISLMADPEEKYNHEYVKMAVSGSYIHIAWKGMAKDYSHNILYYTRSSDGGITFETPRQLVKDANQNDSEFKPEWNNFVADGAYVHLVYTIGWPRRLVYLRSVNNGESFYPPYILHAGGYYNYPGIHMAAENGKLAVVWAISSDYATLLCDYSDNGGETFSLVQMAQAASKSVSFTVHDLVRSGDYLYVLSSEYDGQYYHESRMFLWSSWNSGAAFNTPLQVTVPTAEGKDYATKIQDAHYSPNLTADGKLVNMVWINNDNPGSFDGWWAPTLRTRRSADGGLTLEEPVTLHTFPAGYQSGANAGLETITGKGSNLYITAVLSDKPAGTYVWRSGDSGKTWSIGAGVSAGGWWPLIRTDSSDLERIHLVNSGYYLSRDSGATFNGGVNPHYPFNDWQWEQFFVDDSGVGHLAAASGANASSYEILYRRLGPEPYPGSADKALTLVNEGNTRRDNMQVPAAPDLNPTGAMTLEFWFRRESEAYNSQTFVELVAKKRLLSGYSSYALGLWDNFQIYCRLVTDKSANSSYGEWLGSGFVPPLGQWTHIAMTYDAGPAADNLKLYVNGLLHGTVSIQGNILTDTMDSQLLIGNRDQNAGSGSFSVDEIRLWNMTRSQAEIIADMGKQLVGNETGLAAYYNCNDTVRDITGRENDGFLMFRESFTTTGSKPPQVTALSPEIGAAGVSLSGRLTMTFNENILTDAGDITIRDITANSAGTVFEVIPVKSSQVTVSGKTVTISPSLNFSTPRKYAVTMPATCFKSSGGLYFQGISSTPAWNFTTGEQGQSLLSVSPASWNVAKYAGTCDFRVSNTGTGTMNWTARVISGTWLRITSGFSGSGAGTVNCAFDANSDTSERRAVIRVTAAGAAGSPADVTVTQAKAFQTPPTFQPGPGMNDGSDDGSIDAGKDAEFYICRGEWSGTNTYISGVARSTCNDCNSKAYIQFDVSTLPDDVGKVYLVVTHLPHTEHCYSMCAANFYFYPVLTPWDEMSVPQTPPEEGEPILGPIPISFPNDFGKREYDITEIYRQWKNGTTPNNGLVIYSRDTGCINAPAFWGVYSSDNPEIAKRPYLKFAVKGDINGDGQSDLKDTVLILQIIAGIQPESGISLSADVDGDGRIGIADVICAMNF